MSPPSRPFLEGAGRTALEGQRYKGGARSGVGIARWHLGFGVWALALGFGVELLARLARSKPRRSAEIGEQDARRETRHAAILSAL